MALIKCPECGKEISNQADACIHCGYPLTVDDKNYIVEEKKLELNFLSESEKASGYFCLVNGNKQNIKNLLDELGHLNKDECERVKEAALYGKNKDSRIRGEYLQDVKKTEEGARVYDIKEILIRKIMKDLDLIYFSAHEFLYEVMENGNKAPEEYNGKSASEQRREWDAEMAEKRKYQPKCPTCGSPDIEKLRKSETSGSILFFGGVGFANELAGKTYRCRHCKYTW